MKKSISFILVMLMVLCMVPGVALADSNVAKIERTGIEYPSIQAAVDAAENGDTVKLLSNVDLTEANRASALYNVLIYVNNKNITLDMNGKTISLTHKDVFTNPGYIVSVICVEDNAGLTVTGNGKIDVDAHDTDPDIAYIFFKRGSTGYLTIENGIYHMNNSADSMVYTHGSDIVTVNGGTFTLDKIGTSTNGSPWIFNVQGQNNGHIIVNGGTFNFDINHQYWCFEVEVAKEKALKKNDDGTWTVVNAVAWVNEREYSGGWWDHPVGYTSLADAFNAVVRENRPTVYGKTGEYDGGPENVGLVTDCPINTTLMVNESFELIPNGKTIIWEGNDTDPMFTVAAGKTLTLPDNFTPKRNGYVFQGLFTDVNRTIPYVPAAAGNATRSTGDISIYAKWSVDAPTSSGYSGPDLWYIGGNTFGVTTNQVPTSVEIDNVPVSFTMNGNQITVGCIQPGSDWVTVRWGSVSNQRSFTPDANAYCTQTVIPKTGDVSFWAAITEFFGF